MKDWDRFIGADTLNKRPREAHPSFGIWILSCGIPKDPSGYGPVWADDAGANRSGFQHP
jgi:hypothetical protein